MVEFYNYKFGILVKDDGTPAKKGLNLVSSKDYHALEAKLAALEAKVAEYEAAEVKTAEYEAALDAWGKKLERLYAEHRGMAAALSNAEAKAAEYEAAILRMYFRIHNSQGDLQTALEWSRI